MIYETCFFVHRIKYILRTNLHIMKKLYLLTNIMLLLIVFSLNNASAANKYIQANSNWSTAVWYDLAAGGSIVAAPTSADDVFTNGYVLTVNTTTAACRNIEITDLVNALTVSATNTLTISGVLSKPGGNTVDALAGTGTIKFIATSGVINSNIFNPNAFNGDVIIDPGLGNSVDFGSSLRLGSATARLIIASGTVNTLANSIRTINNAQGTVWVQSGSILNVEGNQKIGSNAVDANRMGTVTIDGTLNLADDAKLDAVTISVGANGLIKTLEDGDFYNNAPTTLTCNGTMDYACNGGQNVFNTTYIWR